MVHQGPANLVQLILERVKSNHIDRVNIDHQQILKSVSTGQRGLRRPHDRLSIMGDEAVSRQRRSDCGGRHSGVRVVTTVQK